LERKKERDEKIARGEEVGPEEKDPTAQEEVGLLGLLKFLLIVIVCISLAGKFVTGSYLWEYDGKWVQLRTYLPEVSFSHLCATQQLIPTSFDIGQPGQRLFSERMLAEFDGKVPGRPIYLAVRTLFFSNIHILSCAYVSNPRSTEMSTMSRKEKHINLEAPIT